MSILVQWCWEFKLSGLTNIVNKELQSLSPGDVGLGFSAGDIDLGVNNGWPKK